MTDSANVTAADVMDALERILLSDAFARVERPSRFLRHIVKATLDGQQTLLKETLIGIQVFGREALWDPRLDPIVRQEAARLRKRLAKYYETVTPDVRIELPVGSYVPVFHRVEAQVGEKDPAPPIPSPPPAPEAVSDHAPLGARKSWRYAWAAVAAGLLLAAGIVYAWRYFRTPSSGGVPTIVVLPFTNLGAEAANEYFAAGLTDEITDELVRLPSLKVLARTSAAAFKGKSTDVREVGRRLNVAYVLEGSVERSADQVRISASLDRSSDGSQIWSQTYKRQAKDLLNVQSEVASAIAASLQLKPGMGGASRHIASEQAHELYLRATFEMQDTTPASFDKAEKILQECLRIDPDYAAAWLALGRAKYYESVANGRTRTPAELAEAKEFYRKALNLDPDLSAARANLGLIAMVYDWDWATAERELQSSSRNGLNAPAEMNYGVLLSYRGQFREADRHMELARSLDPTDPSVLFYSGGVRYWESRFPEAIAIFQQILKRYPDQLNPRFMLSISYIESGEVDLALKDLRQLEVRFPPSRFFEVMALGRAGRHEEGLKLLRRLESEYEGDPRVFRQWFALAWAAMGDHARTVKWLGRSADLHEFQVLNLAVNPAFAAMRNDPEFRALVRRIGLN